MTIENRDIKAGQRFTGKYQKKEHEVFAVEGEGGKVLYRSTEFGKDFKSLSAAGMAITGHACNGWVFWSNAGEEAKPEPNESAPKAEKVDFKDVEEHINDKVNRGLVKTPKAIAAATGLNRCPNQQAVPGGKIRWTCNTCHKSFIGGKSATPKDCPICNP